MKKISDLTNGNYIEELNKVLRATGWPDAELEDGFYTVYDEHVTIYFARDLENTGTLYIKKIICNFYSADRANIRDLNGLSDLYDKLDKLNAKYV